MIDSRELINNPFSHLTPKNETNQGVVCRKCWWEVRIFHDFYSRIESLHCVTQTNENIFGDSVTEHLKISVLTKEESNEYKRCSDEEYPTAEYLRDRFGTSKVNRQFASGHFSYFISRRWLSIARIMQTICAIDVFE